MKQPAIERIPESVTQDAEIIIEAPHEEVYDLFKDEKRINELYEMVSQDMVRPDPRDFADQYREEEIEKDLLYVQDLEKEFAEQNTLEEEQTRKVTEITEFLLKKYFSVWSKGTVSAELGSKFDDLKRGVDLILRCRNQHKSETTLHAMKIDVVMGSLENFFEKLAWIQWDIDHAGEFKKKEPAKYFKLQEGESWNSQAHAILSIAPGKVKSLMEKELAGDYQGIENDLAPYLFATQLAIQYDGFGAYADEKGKSEIAQDFRQARNDIQETFKPLFGRMERDQRLREAVERNHSIKNLRIFMNVLAKETEQMPIVA